MDANVFGTISPKIKITTVKIPVAIPTAEAAASPNPQDKANFWAKTVVKEEAEIVATICGDPFIAFGNYGKGKSGVFTTDCAPHWAPPEFCNWEYYNKLFANIFAYLTK